MNKKLKERYKYTDIGSIINRTESLPVAKAIISTDNAQKSFKLETATIDLSGNMPAEPVIVSNLGTKEAQGIRIAALYSTDGGSGQTIDFTLDYPGNATGKYTLRNSIQAASGCSVKVVMRHNQAKDSGSVVNCLTEIKAAKGSKVELIEIASTGAVFLSTIIITQHSDSDLKVVTVDINNQSLVRNQHVALGEQGAECSLSGIYITSNGEHVDNYIDMVHGSPDCVSNQLYKGIVGEGSTAAFTGHILVAADSQRTSAYQQNHNIIMGDNTRVDTRPQLEIYADDVKCSHGATVGKLDPEALYYMRQRGISLKEAKRLQLEGFAEDAVSLPGMYGLHEDLRLMIADKLNNV